MNKQRFITIRKYLTFFFTLTCMSGFAQQVKVYNIVGTVISAYRNTTISNAVIEFAAGQGVRTDKNGHFIIRELSAGQYKLSFSAPDYDNTDTMVVIKDQDITGFVFRIYTDCSVFPQVNRDWALKDIKDGKPKLLLVGGIAPIVFTTDKHFEKKYNIYFSDYGCIPDKQECMLIYNKTIFEYLDKKYGKKWRTEVRQDVIGLHDESR